MRRARLEAIITARTAGATFAEIAAAHGIPRQRVHHIVSLAETRLGQRILWHRETCDTTMTGRPARHGPCRACAARTRCERMCGHRGARFVGTTHAYAYYPACAVETRLCLFRGRPMTRHRGSHSTHVSFTAWFCTRTCLGRYAGRTYGVEARRPSMDLPDGYTITTAAGLAVLCRGDSGGPTRRVTVSADSSVSQLAPIAQRDTHHTARSEPPCP